MEFDIGEAKRTLEYLDTERNRLVDEYTHFILRRADKHHQSNDDSPAHVKVGLGICLPGLLDQDTSFSRHEGDWPEMTSRTSVRDGSVD